MSPSRPAFEVKDLFLEQRIESLDLRPGSSKAVCALRSVVRQDDTYQTQLWMLPQGEEPPRQLTYTAGHNTRPRFAPDDERIAFLSDRHGGSPQVYLMDAYNGEPRQLTRFVAPVIDMLWHPNGRQLALICAVSADPDSRAEGTQEIDLQRPPSPSSAPSVVWRLPYKMDGVGYTLGTRLHIVLLDLDSGQATPLTRGDYDVGHVCWSPDGDRLAFTRGREDEREAHCKDVWVLEIGPHPRPFPPMRQLTQSVATASWPAWAPDGSRIAFMGATNAGDAILRLWMVDLGSGAVQHVGDPDADDSVELVSGPMYWSADGDCIRAIQAWHGVQRIVAIDPVKGAATPLLEPSAGHVTLMAADDCIVYVEEGIDHPIEAHRCQLDGGDARRLSDFNAWWRERCPLKVESRTFQVPDGDGGLEAVQGWLLTKVGSEPGRPLLLDVHGGPASYVMLHFATNPYWQVLASQGWAILALNAVGSASFGRRFSERLRRRWGQLDLPQQRAAVEALKEEGVASDRVAIAGASYGGYFSAYATGNCEDFRAAVVCAPVGNLETHYGTSDSGYYADPFSMEGKPETSRDLMVELSPMSHIARSRTPTLFLQGEDDERCPKCQSEEMFVKLKRSGGTAEMVLYPGGDHHTLGKGRPSHRRDGHGRIVGWLQRWIETPCAKHD